MTQDLDFLAPGTSAVPIRAVGSDDWRQLETELAPPQRAYAEATNFSRKAGQLCLLPDAHGGLARVLFGLGEAKGRDRLIAGKLVGLLPPGAYRFESGFDVGDAALAWCLARYRFERYRKPGEPRPRLVAPDGIDAEAILRVARAVAAGRDLINTPANDLGPAEIEAAIRALAERFGATVAITQGETLARDFPLVHAVGRAVADDPSRAPRLIEMSWGPSDAPRVTLVGKGVVFDTGGLDIKPAAGMLLMKKDMGGAAAAIAAAEMVMGSGLTLRLRLIVPSVENAISGCAFRPGDVIRARSGLTVEIGNTDAEGRLILADALALADAEEPELLIDFATLTGAARVALGPDLPAFFTEDDDLALAIEATGRDAIDPVWRLPLHAPYASLLDSKVADLNNVSGGPFAGAITAALFLRRFAPKTRTHVHFDLYGWNPATKPGRPEGGEVQTARLVHALLSERYPVQGG